MPNTDDSRSSYRPRLRARFLAAGSHGLPDAELQAARRRTGRWQRQDVVYTAFTEANDRASTLYDTPAGCALFPVTAPLLPWPVAPLAANEQSYMSASLFREFPKRAFWIVAGGA